MAKKAGSVDHSKKTEEQTGFANLGMEVGAAGETQDGSELESVALPGPPGLADVSPDLLDRDVVVPTIEAETLPIVLGVPDDAPAPAFVEIRVALPMIVDRFDQRKHGYASGRVDCELTGELGEGFRRLLVGCRNSHLMYKLNGKDTHVETGADLIRYLVSQAVAEFAVQTGDGVLG